VGVACTHCNPLPLPQKRIDYRLLRKKAEQPQSLLNLGIVYRFDLEENEKAKDAWLKYLEVDATGATADRVRTMINHMENGHG
jgi:hypothetical protein